MTSFEASGAAYGYRRVLADANAGRPPGERVGEWTARAVMREEGLVARAPRRRRRHGPYAGEISEASANRATMPNSSDMPYVGEASEAPANLLRDEGGRHHLGAGRPNGVRVADVTEFRIPAGKACLSLITDCLDGRPIGWTISTSPDADMADSSLPEACG